MQVKRIVDDTNNLLKDYLYDGEQVEYYTQSTPEIATKNIIFRTNCLIFLCNVLICVCVSAVIAARELIFPMLICAIFFLFIIRMLNKKITAQLSNFLPDYYFITNCRIIACISVNDGLGYYQISNIRINPELKISTSGKHNVQFSHYFDIIAFDDIPDAKEVYNFMKGKINK